MLTARERVRQHIQKVLSLSNDDASNLTDSESLVLSGRLSSLDIIDVLTFLETEFNYQPDANDFDQARFDSVDSILAMLEPQTR